METTMTPEKLHVLVVDDEVLVFELFEFEFEDEIASGTIQFEFAPGVDEGLGILKGRSGAGISLILSDINMPDRSGFDLLDQVRDQWDNKPVYIISAYSSDNTREKAKKKGANRFFTKPFNFEEIRRAISEDFKNESLRVS